MGAAGTSTYVTPEVRGDFDDLTVRNHPTLAWVRSEILSAQKRFFKETDAIEQIAKDEGVEGNIEFRHVRARLGLSEEVGEIVEETVSNGMSANRYVALMGDTLRCLLIMGGEVPHLSDDQKQAIRERAQFLADSKFVYPHGMTLALFIKGCH